jgi:hypothetical protein
MTTAARAGERPTPFGPATGRIERVDVSVIVPVTERPEPLDLLYVEYAASLRAANISHEFLFAVEPWGRSLAEPLRALEASGEPVRTLESGQVVGEAALLRTAAARANGEIILMLPAYRRVAAEALPELVARVRAGADMAVARRWPRNDAWLNRLQNRAFHAIVGGMAQGRVHDIGCGVRAMPRSLLDQLPLYGDFHRFLPLLALREGYRVEEVDASQHRADAATRVYGPGIYLRRLVDLLGLFFLLRFTEKPLRFFGLAGSLAVLAGGVISGVLVVQRFRGVGLTDRPLLILGVMLVALGIQAIALGLIGEMIVHLQAPRRRPYRLR